MSAPEAAEAKAKPIDPVLASSKAAYALLEARQGRNKSHAEELTVLIARAGLVLHAAVKSRNGDLITQATAQFDVALLCTALVDDELPTAQEDT